MSLNTVIYIVILVFPRLPLTVFGHLGNIVPVLPVKITSISNSITQLGVLHKLLSYILSSFFLNQDCALTNMSAQPNV